MNKIMVCLAALFAALSGFADVPQLINYQGRLLNGTNLFNGSVGLSLRLYSVPAGGLPLYEDSNTVAVVDGQYSTLIGDNWVSGTLGNALTNEPVWLEVVVDGVALTPRERIASVGYALYSIEAQGVSAKAITTAMLADGAVSALKLDLNAVGSSNLIACAVTAAALAPDSVTAASISNGTILATDLNSASFSNMFWLAGGNAGTTPGKHFIGTTDNQALEVKVNGTRALRIEPNVSGAPNFIGGASVNRVGIGVVGATIAGGGATNFSGAAYSNCVDACFGMIGGGANNSIQLNAFSSFLGAGSGNSIQAGASDSFLGGGLDNSIQVSSYDSFLGGGRENSIRSGAYYSFIGGGSGNSIQANANSTLCGGQQNNIQAGADHAMLGGGSQNSIRTNANYSALGGGEENSIQTDAEHATLGGGYQNSIQPYATYSTLGGGYQNSIQPYATYSTLGGGCQNSIQVNATFSTLGGGYRNSIQTNAYMSMLGGGSENSIQTNAYSSTLGGGHQNSIQTGADNATLGGGYQNVIQLNAVYATLGGGYRNNIGTNASYSAIPGGRNNAVGNNATNALAAGYRAKAHHGGTFVWADNTDADFASSADNQFLIRASGNVGIGTGSPLSPLTVAKTVAAGRGAELSLVNYATSSVGNEAALNFGLEDSSYNMDSGNAQIKARIRSSPDNKTDMIFSTYNGGSDFAERLRIQCDGKIGVGTNSPAAQMDVSSSSSGDSFPQLRVDQRNLSDYARLRFTMGGEYGRRWDVTAQTNLFVIYSGHFGAEMLRLDSAGLTVRGTFVSSSDRNLKENYQPVDPREILAKVAAMPVRRWNYKQDAASRHIGPVAQDFHAAFGLGSDDTHIAMVDADGVALAAIQALNSEVKDQKSEVGNQRSELRGQKSEIESLKKENAELKTQLDALKARLDAMAGGR